MRACSASISRSWARSVAARRAFSSVIRAFSTSSAAIVARSSAGSDGWASDTPDPTRSQRAKPTGQRSRDRSGPHPPPTSPHPRGRCAPVRTAPIDALQRRPTGMPPPVGLRVPVRGRSWSAMRATRSTGGASSCCGGWRRAGNVAPSFEGEHRGGGTRLIPEAACEPRPGGEPEVTPSAPGLRELVSLAGSLDAHADRSRGAVGEAPAGPAPARRPRPRRGPGGDAP